MRLIPFVVLIAACAVDPSASQDLTPSVQAPPPALVPNYTTGTLTCGGQPLGQGCSVRLAFYDANGFFTGGGAMTDPNGDFSALITCSGHADGGEYWEVSSDCCDTVFTIPTDGCDGDLGDLECCPDTGCVTPPPDMVAWWPFDETSPATAEDIAGSTANDGGWANGPVPVPGMVAGALGFDGINDFVRVPDDPEIDFMGGAPLTRTADDLSIDAWIKVRPNDAAGVRVIVDKRQKIGVKPRGYSMFLSNGRLGFQMADAGGAGAACGAGAAFPCTNWVAGPSLADGNWHLVAVTVERPALSTAAPYGRLYVDGVQVGSFAPRGGVMDNNSSLVIGRRNPAISGGGFYKGVIDELEIFKRALTPTEIFALWEAEAFGKCKDEEEICDGLDNNGDGQVDEGFPDTDGDGTADCVDREECDGLDNNGDGAIDEGFPDTDGDGIADCVDREECDCLDNDGDGVVDEDCRYDLTLQLSVDDAYDAYLDGAPLGSGLGWGTLFTHNATIGAGVHHVAVYGWDIGQVVAGFIGGVFIDGTPVSYTGSGSWLASNAFPGASWQTSVAGYGFAPNVAFNWPGTNPLETQGATWIWTRDGLREDLYPENWFITELKVCGEYQQHLDEICDGRDNNGNGIIDEGYPDTDGDGIADCVDVEEICNGIDDDGDGIVDDGFPDTDYDGIADCVDRETCDGLDNNGDGQVDEGYPDSDHDGIADCVDREECDCLDNDGDGQVDEPGGPYDTDGDGVPDSDVCLYRVRMQMSADDTFRAWLDGSFIGSDPDTNWQTPWGTSALVPYGTHLLSVEAGDVYGAHAGFIGNVQVNAVNHPTGNLGNWTESYVAPPAGWESTWQGWGADTEVLPDATCSPALAAWGAAPGLAGLYASGAEWVWQRQCVPQWPRNWFQLQFHTCPRRPSTLDPATPIDICAADPTLCR